MSSAVPRTLTRPCVICGEPFTALVKAGRPRTRCEKHPKDELPALLLPNTGICIARQCLCCHCGFIAHHAAAQYCGIPCFLKDRKGKPIPESQKLILQLHRRKRSAVENRP